MRWLGLPIPYKQPIRVRPQHYSVTVSTQAVTSNWREETFTVKGSSDVSL